MSHLVQSPIDAQYLCVASLSNETMFYDAAMYLDRVQQEAVQVMAASHNLFITEETDTGTIKTVSSLDSQLQLL